MNEILRWLEKSQNFEDDQLKHCATQGKCEGKRKDDDAIPYIVVSTQLSNEE